MISRFHNTVRPVLEELTNHGLVPTSMVLVVMSVYYPSDSNAGFEMGQNPSMYCECPFFFYKGKSTNGFGGNTLRRIRWVNNHGVLRLVIDNEVCVIIASPSPYKRFIQLPLQEIQAAAENASPRGVHMGMFTICMLRDCIGSCNGIFS